MGSLSGLDPVTLKAGLLLVFSAVVLVVLLILRGRGRRAVEIRPLSAFRDLQADMGEAAESGDTIHIALGTGGIDGPEAVISLAGFEVLEAVAGDLVSYYTPPVVTVGDPTLLFLAQDVMRRAYERRGLADLYDPTRVRFVAPTPLAYAAGTSQIVATDDLTASVLVGAFGSEVSLIADAGRRQRLPHMAAMATADAVGALYPVVADMAIGEEMFSAGAQVTGRNRSLAGLAAQDVVRVVLVAAILLSGLSAFLRGGL
ncbi:MAG: hypothetical protein GX620_01630 [Chloroflexi bacterium]|nr:hypothetical protein [Chloroflexota bacterium]